ncbi:S66 peptidase family protein [Streptomyces varsoviensis]|uniref:S66 peptidase family protein n=1 Tax=Streptomyces varsoviensis TaxID=67373 RepID=UPI0004C56457|nr:S66 peptidase family protein [Streptomyces varsoviensis]
MREKHVPPALRAGDHVAVISPSWGGAGLFPDRFDRALDALAGQLKLTGLPTPHAHSTHDWRSAGARERADDLNQAFRDETIGGILCAIGGDHAAQLLPLLDWDAIAARPKVFCGYSDATVLHHAIYATTGATTFYGPAVLSQFGEWPDPDEYTVEHFRTVAMEARPAGPVPKCPYVVDEFGDWGATGRPRSRHRRPAPDRVALRPGSGSGPLLAACLPSARQLLGTPWQPPYAGHVLVIETPPDYSPADADRDLTHLRNAGCLDELAALVVGRPPRLGPADRERLHAVVLDAVAGFGYPVLAEFECGHTDPVATLPIGVACAVDGRDLTLLDAAVAP